MHIQLGCMIQMKCVYILKCLYVVNVGKNTKGNQEKNELLKQLNKVAVLILDHFIVNQKDNILIFF